MIFQTVNQLVEASTVILTNLSVYTIKLVGSQFEQIVLCRVNSGAKWLKYLYKLIAKQEDKCKFKTKKTALALLLLNFLVTNDISNTEAR